MSLGFPNSIRSIQMSLDFPNALLDAKMYPRLIDCVRFLYGVPDEVLRLKGKSDLIDLFLAWLQSGGKEQTPLAMMSDEIQGMITSPVYISRSILLDLLKRWVNDIETSYSATIDRTIATLQVLGLACSKCGGYGKVAHEHIPNGGTMTPRQHTSGFKCTHCNGSRREPEPEETS